MKNIQTGNTLTITNIGDTITIYSEAWDQGDTRYRVIASTKITGTVDGPPCYFSYEAVCLATPKDSCTFIVGLAVDHVCIDDALSELEDCLEVNGIKWYAPQTLGI